MGANLCLENANHFLLGTKTAMLINFEGMIFILLCSSQKTYKMSHCKLH